MDSVLKVIIWIVRILSAGIILFSSLILISSFIIDNNTNRDHGEFYYSLTTLIPTIIVCSIATYITSKRNFRHKDWDRYLLSALILIQLVILTDFFCN
jgi:cell division protein FtsW (lipid II flippase)